jgi:hypothetical protein
VTETPDDTRFAAAVALIGRTGADEFQIRYCEEEAPTVWIAVAHWPKMTDPATPEHYDAAGGLSPWRAVLRLCEATMDGGTCRHCHRPTGVDDRPADELLRATEEIICWYRYDPELDTFRRSCEGVT